MCVSVVQICVCVCVCEDISKSPGGEKLAVEKKLVVEQDGRFFLSMKGQKDLIRRRRITQLSSFVIPFRNKLVVSSSSLLE